MRFDVYTPKQALHNAGMEHDWKVSDTFDLDRIATLLEGLEETIIYRMLDRAQFARNRRAYVPGESSLSGMENLSLFEARLFLQESLEARFGRFLVPEERPYSQGLPVPERTPPKASNEFHSDHFDLVSQNGLILSEYQHLLDTLCVNDDDGHYGSSVEQDVQALQAVARRVHFGALYVAESKFRSDTETYTKLAREKDTDGLLKLLTRTHVEERILLRVADKIDDIQRSVNSRIRRTIEPSILMDFYRTVVIPLTKKGEVAWLLGRVA